jgi:hypothetical protein
MWEIDNKSHVIMKLRGSFIKFKIIIIFVHTLEFKFFSHTHYIKIIKDKSYPGLKKGFLKTMTLYTTSLYNF